MEEFYIYYHRKKIVTEGQLWFITIGGITQFVMYSRKFAGPINEFANIISEFQSAYTAAERIFRIIDEEPEPLDNQDAIVLENTLGDVELKKCRIWLYRRKNDYP